MKHFSIFTALGIAAAVGVAAQAGEQAVLKTSEHHQQDRRLIQLRYGTTMLHGVLVIALYCVPQYWHSY